MGPEFDDLILRRTVAHAALQDQAQWARTNPYSVLKGILGNSAIVASNADPQNPLRIPAGTNTAPGLAAGSSPMFNIINNREAVAWWQGTDAETLPASIMFGIDSPQPAVPNFDETAGFNAGGYRPYGIIKFGTKGFLQTVEVDINNGCQFTINCAMAAVDVAMEPDIFQVNTPAQTSIMKLYGQISFWPCVKTVPCTRTRYYDSEKSGPITTGNNTGLIQVPQFAKSVVVFRSNNTPVSPAMRVDFRNAMRQLIYTQAFPNAAQMVIPTELSNDVYYLTVTNTDTPDIQHVRSVFNLSF